MRIRIRSPLERSGLRRSRYLGDFAQTRGFSRRRGRVEDVGNFKKTLLCTELQLKHLAATVEHGLLHIKMEDPTAIEPMDVVVSNVALSDEDVESNKKLVALLRRSAAEFPPTR